MKLELHGIIKSFLSEGKPQRALDGVTFVSEFPHVLALIGPSGGGKSTLLRILAGLTAPDSGEVRIDGALLPTSERELRATRSRLGVVFQSFNLFPHMTALANVMLPLVRVHGMPDTEAKERALQIMELLGLADHSGKYPLQLSGGQSQRVAIARALVTLPACVLADEPTGNLDRSTADGVFELMLQLARDKGTAFIVVTHDHSLAARCQRQLILAQGVLQKA